MKSDVGRCKEGGAATLKRAGRCLQQLFPATRPAPSLPSERYALSAPYLLRWTARKRAASSPSSAQAKFNSGKTIDASRMSSKRYVVNEKGEKKAVIMPIEEYEKLIEDLHDLAVIAERRDEPTIPLDEIIEKLKKNGILPSPT